ncbi:MAG: hypothetical protein ACYCO9_19565 [Streptosporangiaceae bacterium]
MPVRSGDERFFEALARHGDGPPRLVPARVGAGGCAVTPPRAESGPSLSAGIGTRLPGKLAAIGAFASQAGIRDRVEPDLIQSTARYWGRFANARYTGAFAVVADHGAVMAGPTSEAPHAAA